MYRNFALTICLLMIFPVFSGCDSSPPPPAKHKVIRKKITAKPPLPPKPVIAEIGNEVLQKTGPEIKPNKDEKDKEEKKSSQIIASAKKELIPDKKEIKKAEEYKSEKKEKKSVKKYKIAGNIKTDDDRKSDIGKDTEKDTTDILKSAKEEKTDELKPEGKSEKSKMLAYAKEKIDPFAPLFRTETEQKKQSKKVVGSKKSKGPKTPPRRLTPLEKLDLSQLKLVGIVRAESGNKALVEEASGKGYIITIGTYIGIHSGKVTEILKDRVIVEEKEEDLMGNVTIRKRELKFQRPSGEDYYEM